MRLRFQSPEKKSRIDFYASEATLWRAVLAQARSGAFFLVEARFRSQLPKFVREKTLFLRGGESCKNSEALFRVLQFLAEAKAERSQALVVIGGGALCDLGALAASLYRRGCPLVLVPTTLLAAVDASVGGKSAIDLAEKNLRYKNVMGAFYPADAVWIAAHFWKSLPAREWRSGRGELYKMLWLKGTRPPLNKQKGMALLPLVKKAIQAKIRVVEQDPLDTKRIREQLNYGHTIGHVLEAHQLASHGECVLLGMLWESELAGARESFLQKLEACVRREVKTKKVRFTAHSVRKTLASDKKVRQGRMEMSVLLAPGKIQKITVDPKTLEKFILDAVESFLP